MPNLLVNLRIQYIYNNVQATADRDAVVNDRTAGEGRGLG